MCPCISLVRGERLGQGTRGLVAMTSAQHAEGRQFDPGRVYAGSWAALGKPRCLCSGQWPQLLAAHVSNCATSLAITPFQAVKACPAPRRRSALARSLQHKRANELNTAMQYMSTRGLVAMTSA